jgi:hypothetical protein
MLTIPEDDVPFQDLRIDFLTEPVVEALGNDELLELGVTCDSEVALYVLT